VVPFERLVEEGEELVVAAEVGDVGEGEVDRPSHAAGPAELAQLGALAVAT
jgi:hypothetical protein